MTTAPKGIEQADWDAAGKDATLGVGHVWTRVECPAYQTFKPADCNCNSAA